MAHVPPPYFSDTELGLVPLVRDDLPESAWRGLSATFHRFVDLNYFAHMFPLRCEDNKGIYGTNNVPLLALLSAHVPRLGGWPAAVRPAPDTVTAMDLVVFGWRHVALPSVRNHHEFPDHDHYLFDEAAGRVAWRDEVNEILERNGVALRQESDGRVVRVGTAAVDVLTRAPIPPSGDGVVDEKLTTALKKVQDPDIEVRREALEALWDAFERVKTVMDSSDKRRSSEALIGLMAADEPGRAVLRDEFFALKVIGNNFQIRHHEVGKHPVGPAMVDLLFARCLTLVEGAAKALHGRAGVRGGSL